MKRHYLCLLAMLCMGVVTDWSCRAAGEPPVRTHKPKVDMVFVRDTTGSMGGFIQAAKEKA